MRKLIVLLVALAVLMPFVIGAGEHGINGYVADADDGTSADGAVVVFFIETRPTQILTDVVGAAGHSGNANFYSTDVKNFPTPWTAGEKVIIMIMKDEYHGATTEVILSNGPGNQQAPNTQLSQCTGAMCSFCGDFICDNLCNETIENCPQDCGGDYCGDGMCTGTEDCLFCPIDCPMSECGDGICDCPETLISCAIDCAPTECDYDGICDYGETAESCPDCIIDSCGNGKCEEELGESEATCPIDCPPVVCGDGLCEVMNGENARTCPADCQRMSLKCGNLKCEPGETQDNCCFDCGCPKGQQCLKNNCTGCCFIGFCFSFLGICWYWLLTIIVIIGGIVTVVIIEMKKKKHAMRAVKAAAHAVKKKK